MRGAGAALLVLLATVLAPFLVTASWVSTTLDDTDSYVDTVAPLADDPTLRRELADEMTSAAMAELQSRLVVPLPDGIEDITRRAAERTVENPDFPEFWREANRDAHREFLRVMRDDAADGWVTIDLSPLMSGLYESLGEDTGLPLSGLPAPELRVPVVRESRLAEYRTEYRVAEGSAFVLAVAWIVLVGIAVLVASGWRGRVRTFGFALLGLALGSLLVLVATPPVTDAVAEHADPGKQGLVALVLHVVGDSLGNRATWVGIVAAVCGLAVLAVSLWPRRRTASSGAPSWG